MKKFTDQLLARHSRLGKRTSIIGGLAAVSMAVIVGTVAVVASFAANEQLYLSPPTASVVMGNTIAVEIRVNSGTDTVNAVQANLSYDPSQLAFQSVDPSGSPFSLSASSVTTSGVVQLARATGGGSPAVSGDNLFATVTFKALLDTGTANIKIDAGSHVVRSTDSTDILTSSAGASFTLTAAGGGATPTPTPDACPTPPVTNAPGCPGNSGTPSPTPSVVPSTSPTPGPSTPPGNFTGKLMLSPATSSIASGANATFDIMEDSGTTPVNAIQANLMFDPTKLEYVGADSTGADFPLNAVTSTGNGSVKLTRALNGGDPAVTGSKLVAKVTFKVLAASGSATVSYDAGSVISTLDGLNALVSSVGASITVTGGGGGTPTPTPVTSPTPTPVPGGGGTTPTPTVQPLDTPVPTAAPTPVTGTNSTPVPATPAPIANPVVTIPVVGAKGALKVTGQTKLTAPSIPAGLTIAYAIDSAATAPVIDTTTLDNGTHIVTATATDPATGKTQQVKQKISVENTQPLWKSLVDGLKTSWPYLILVLAVIALGVGLWLFMRRISQAPATETAPLYVDNMRQDRPAPNVIHPTQSNNNDDQSGPPKSPLGF